MSIRGRFRGRIPRAVAREEGKETEGTAIGWLIGGLIIDADTIAILTRNELGIHESLADVVPIKVY